MDYAELLEQRPQSCLGMEYIAFECNDDSGSSLLRSRPISIRLDLINRDLISPELYSCCNKIVQEKMKPEIM
jgi:hypothetical protein